jgi:hypothetical protein
MAGWFFQLKGEGSDLEQAATLFEAGEICVTREGDEFWMRSTALDALSDHGEAHRAAEAKLEILNGVSLLRVQNTGRLTLGRAEYGEASAPRNIFVRIGGVQVTTRVGIPTVSISGRPAPPREDSILKAANKNADVAEVMRIYGSREPDWRDLYWILEAVEKDIGMTVSKKRWISTGDRELFRRTANSRGALGNLARHGKSTTPPPKRPMPLSEARGLIRVVVELWTA